MQLETGREFAGYDIVRRIGGGGMAQIYLAKTTGLAGFEKYLALKVINREYANEDRFIQMLINEAKIAVGLSHVNVAQVFDLGECDGIYYIAMEYVDGLDVLELVNGLHAIDRHVPVEAVAFIGRQICGGLHYAHTRKDKDGNPQNIVHRDISPQNVLVSRAGEVKLVDFGIAKAAGMRTRTQAGVIKGKVNYMAPEQVLGKKADARTDIFAVGIVVWEMLTSQMVYVGDNVEELAAKVRKANIAPPSRIRPEVPPELDAIVARALHPNPLERFQTAHQFQIELTKFMSATAPDYSGSNLSRLVDIVTGDKAAVDPSAVYSQVMSHEDRLEDQHSVIFKRNGEAELVVDSADGHQSYHVTSDLVIGRAAQLAVADARVSRQHARVRRVGTSFLVEDLGSSNGTYVDGKRVVEPHMLQNGSVIKVGNCEIVFRLMDVAEESQAAATPERDEVSSIRLIASAGEQTQEQLVTENTELAYEVQIGDVRLSGKSADLIRRPDGFWLEPNRGRSQIRRRGKQIKQPVRLNPGDNCDIDGVDIAIED